MVGSTSGPDDRLDRLERDMADVRSVLVRLEPVLKTVNDDVKEIKGRLSSMPTTWQIMGLVVALFAGSAAVIRLLAK